MENLMIQGNEIDNLVTMLTARGINLYHACQWVEMESYLKFGALTSPERLKKERLDVIGNPVAAPDAFPWMDARVHFTLSDVGSAYAQDTGNLPNPRGPIVLQILPAALKAASEVGICLRSADADNSTLEQETFLPLKDIEYLFRYTPEAPLPEKTYLKSTEALEKEFGVKNVQSPEIFCRFTNDRLPFDSIHKIMVDHYQLHHREFRDWLYELQYQYDSQFLIERRYCSADIGGHLLKSLAHIIREEVPTLETLSEHPDEKVSQWSKGLLRDGRKAHYNHFAHGLRKGTLLPVQTTSELYFDEVRNVGAKNPQPQRHFSTETRQLIDKLLSEKIPRDSIARIVDVPAEELTQFLHRTGRE
jgi:hypothetical protein